MSDLIGLAKDFYAFFGRPATQLMAPARNAAVPAAARSAGFV
jgi:hypothetical protein